MIFKKTITFFFLCLILISCGSPSPESGTPTPGNIPSVLPRRVPPSVPSRPSGLPSSVSPSVPSIPPAPPPHADYKDALAFTGNDLGSVLINTRKIALVTLTNTSDQPVESLSMTGLYSPLRFQGFSFPGTTGNCSSTLTPGASCTIAVEVDSSPFPKDIEETASLTYQVLSKLYFKDIPLKAKINETASLVANDIDFGAVEVGDETNKELKLENTSVAETIKNVTIKQKSGSEFVIENTAKCRTFYRSCSLNVSFAPKSVMTASEHVEISYELGGVARKETIKIAATAVPPEQTLKVDGSNFGNVVADFNEKGAIQLTVTRIAGMAAITDIKLDALGSGFTQTPSGCSWAFLSNINASCKLTIETPASLTSNLAVNQNLRLTYRFIGGAEKSIPLTVTGVFTINGLDVTGQNFTYLAIPAGSAAPVKLLITNPLNSSLGEAQITGISGHVGSVLELDTNDAVSTCLGTFSRNLYHGNSCSFVFKAKPNASIANFTKDLKISFKGRGNTGWSYANEEKSISVNGRFDVLPASLAQNLVVSGQNFGGPVSVNQGSSFDVAITVKNPAMSQPVKTFAIERNGMPWDPGYFIQLDQGKTTCKATTTLNAGQECKFILRFSPDRDDTAFSRPFIIKYSDFANNARQIALDIAGSFKLVIKKAAPQPGGKPTLIYATSSSPGEWFNYNKRPLKSSLSPGNPYPAWVLNKIPYQTYSKVDHVPWSFPVPFPNSLTKLSHIVPGRIIWDGKPHVMLFHGTTSDLTDVFAPGATAINFAAATSGAAVAGGGGAAALGGGFYLSADPNESKEYACDRLGSRKGKPGSPPDLHGLLLVVGIEVNDAIQGKESSTDLSDSAGNPTDPSIYFRRNDRMYNQFVVFKNAAPYMRIIGIIELGKNFGKSKSIHDGDGLGTNSPIPTNAAPFICDK